MSVLSGKRDRVDCVRYNIIIIFCAYELSRGRHNGCSGSDHTRQITDGTRVTQEYKRKRFDDKLYSR